MELVAAVRCESRIPRRPLHAVPTGELSAMYARHAEDVRRIVSDNLTLTDDVLDDACQFAWSSLVMGHTRIAAGAELRWLVTTATREALRLLRLRRLGPVPALSLVPDADEDPTFTSVRARECLQGMRQLPDRQQRMVWLQVLGYGYREIASVTGDSPRTVQRQLARARQRLRAASVAS